MSFGECFQERIHIGCFFARELRLGVSGEGHSKIVFWQALTPEHTSGRPIKPLVPKRIAPKAHPCPVIDFGAIAPEQLADLRYPSQRFGA
jgi:hypothetical protein